MALRVWLPLNGTLDNIGISDITMNGTPASWGNGKIGKCATFTGNVNQRLTSNQTNELDYTDNFSWCMWVNPNYTSGSTQYVFTVGRADATTYGYGANIPNATSLTCRFGNSTWGVDVASNEWTHVAFTKQGTSIKIYRNGELKINQTFSGTLPEFTQSLGLGLGCFYYSGGNIYPFFGSLNDFRIYDHCLSPKEVKEISQGLVLHYKLDSKYFESTTNLITTEDCLSSTCYNGATSKYGYGTNTDMYKEVTIFEGIKGTKVYMGTNGNNAFPYVYVSNMFTSDGTNQPAYKTLSFDYYTNIGTSIRVYKLGSGSGTASYKIINSNGLSIGSATDAVEVPIITNEWNHIEITFHGTTSANSEWGYIQNYPSHVSNTQNFWFFANMQLEEKDHATGYAGPGGTRSAGVICDSSGYGNDGIIVGTLTTQQDSPRYDISTAFAASSAINCGRGAMVTDSITVNLWAKYSSYSNLVSCTEGGGWNFENNSGLTFPVYIASIGYIHIDAANRPPVANYANSWHMFTGVYDRLNKLTKLYIDGELIGTGVVSASNLIQYHSSNVIWLNAEATGSNETGSYGNAKSFSDFRIYATALSEEDILDLYHTPANADNLGGLHGFEFIDNINNRIMEANGTIATKNWNNSTLLKNYQQTNCQVTLTDDGLRIYRPPNYNPTDNGNTMWGGMRINNTRDGGHPIYGSEDNPIGLEKGHTYIIAFHVKGKSSNATNNYGWSNQMGWGGGGLGPTPTDVSYDLLPSNFNGEKECWYKWTINDDIVKTCTTSYSYAVAGNQYMSYADFAFGWQYQDTGALGSDVYITNLRLYDITNLDISNIQKNGVINFTQLDELTQTDKTSITFYKELQVNNFIEK